MLASERSVLAEDLALSVGALKASQGQAEQRAESLARAKGEVQRSQLGMCVCVCGGVTRELPGSGRRGSGRPCTFTRRPQPLESAIHRRQAFARLHASACGGSPQMTSAHTRSLQLTSCCCILRNLSPLGCCRRGGRGAAGAGSAGGRGARRMGGGEEQPAGGRRTEVNGRTRTIVLSPRHERTTNVQESRHG